MNTEIPVAVHSCIGRPDHEGQRRSPSPADLLQTYRRRLSGIALLAILCAGFETINLGALVPLLQLMNSDGVPGGSLWAALTAVFAFIGLSPDFLTLIAVLAILFLIGQCLLFLKKKIQTRLWFDASSDLKDRIFRQAMATDIGYHLAHKSGSIINLLSHESEKSANVLFVVTELITYSFFICAYCAMLRYISAPMTVLCLDIAIAALLLLNLRISASKRMRHGMVETNLRMSEFINERIGTVKLVKIFFKGETGGPAIQHRRENLCPRQWRVHDDRDCGRDKFPGHHLLHRDHHPCRFNHHHPPATAPPPCVHLHPDPAHRSPPAVQCTAPPARRGTSPA